MFEVLSEFQHEINQSQILTQLELKEKEFFVVSAHREENIGSDCNFEKLVIMLNAIAKHYHYPVIVSTHPRTRQKIEQKQVQFHQLVRLIKPLGFKAYNKLQMTATAVLSDSGTISEESSILNFPALNIREAHERPEGMEEAVVMMVGLDTERVMQSLSILETQSRGERRALRLVADYSMPNVSEKIVRIIHSYTDYINRVIWKRY
jgi:UDP-N-acetylglucosamine 2-epimerase (non-hydrolysing)